MIRRLSVAASLCCSAICTFGLQVVPLASFRKIQCISLDVSKQEWSAVDDWTNLSSEAPGNAVADSNQIYNTDIVANAAELMEANAVGNFTLSEEDALISDNIDIVHHHGFYVEPSPSDPALYDTSFEENTKTITFEDEMGAEISMLVRCNQVPDELLITEGRALAPLTDEERNDASQLVTMTKDGAYEATEYFIETISKIFKEHAEQDKGADMHVLKPSGVAKWMTKALKTEEAKKIGPHDRRVGVTIAKFGTFGTGYLTENNFLDLYLSVATTKQTSPKPKTHYSSMKNMQQPDLGSLWRDIRNHGFLAPVEIERNNMAEKIRDEFGAADRSETIDRVKDFDTLHDECEIVGWGDSSDEPSMSSSSDVLATRDENEEVRPSSHKLVELASDNKTPLRVRDGEFVFIDEESCIGCRQCSHIAPSNFLMLEDGRARTFFQSNVPAIQTAVSACPVDCMHFTSFYELKEMEGPRDNTEIGDPEDLKNFNHRRGHTPLHVAGIDSDANHKSSWFHYIRNKLFVSESHFNATHREAEHVRAQHFMKSGEADPFRKTAEL